jgi:hypothetical protein
MARHWALVLGLLLAGGAVSSASAASLTAETISIGGARAALLTNGKPRGAIILMSGGSGQIGLGENGAIANGNNQLVRTREAYAQRGFAVLVPEPGINLAEAVTTMRRYGKVTLVGTSRGTVRAAEGIAAGARPDRLVLTSGLLAPESSARGRGENAIGILGSPASLPPTLIVHHRQDACKVTLPAGVEPFIAWAGGRARVTWLSGGRDEGDECQPFAHHGFYGQDGQVVGAVAGFAAR